MSQWKNFKKIELHRHLEGAIRVQTLIDVAPEAGIVLPSRELKDVEKQALVTTPLKDLSTVLQRMWFVQSFLATPSIVERVSYENVIDAYNDGVRLLELRYSPSFIRANHRNLSFESIHEAILQGVHRGEKELGFAIKVGLICIITREQPASEALETAEFAKAHKDTFVGFDLAGDEVSIKASLFQEFFKQVKQSGLGITVHAGEALQMEAASTVKDAIDQLGAVRIGHGIQVIQDPQVMDYVKERGVTLEICPTSNVLTQAVPSISQHPIKKLIDTGVKVTVNSDDPHFFGITLTHEYDLLHTTFGFDEALFTQLNQNAWHASFIPAHEKEKVRICDKIT